MFLEEAKVAMNMIMTYGLGTVLAIFITFAFWRMLIYVFKENSKREDRLANIIENHIKSLTESFGNLNTSTVNNFAQTHAYILDIKEANKLQREEHKEMVKTLQGMQTEMVSLSVQLKEK